MNSPILHLPMSHRDCNSNDIVHIATSQRFTATASHTIWVIIGGESRKRIAGIGNLLHRDDVDAMATTPTATSTTFNNELTAKWINKMKNERNTERLTRQHSSMCIASFGPLNQIDINYTHSTHTRGLIYLSLHRRALCNANRKRIFRICERFLLGHRHLLVYFIDDDVSVLFFVLCRLRGPVKIYHGSHRATTYDAMR